MRLRVWGVRGKILLECIVMRAVPMPELNKIVHAESLTGTHPRNNNSGKGPGSYTQARNHSCTAQKSSGNAQGS